MTRKEFYNEILKLAPSEYDASKCEFRDHLKKTLNDYLVLLDKLDVDERPEGDVWDDIVQKNKKLIEAINKSVEYYYEGRHSRAFEELNKNISTIGINVLTNLPDLYRMRIFDDGEKHDRNGMFHIPFNKRTIVKTQRYSIPGYPCLYLGASAYVCWEEMHRPNLDKYYVSRFYSDREKIRFIDLSLPTWYSNIVYTGSEKQYVDKTVKELKLDLQVLPLVLACMVKVAKSEDAFKPEYIIPQLLMEWVIEKRNASSKQYHKELIGIVYTSVHKSNDFTFPLSKLTNYAIPAFMKNSDETKYSKELCEMFQLTEPTCDELERAKCPYKAIKRDEEMSDLEYNYRILGQLEARLKDEKKFPLKKIDNSTFGS